MNESKATRYQRLRRRAQLVSVAAGGGLVLLVALTPAANALAAFSISQAVGWPEVLRPAIALGVFVGALAVAAELVALPASMYAAKHVATRLTQTQVPIGTVVASQARDAVVGATLALGVSVLLRFSIWAGGSWWWALASLLLAGATLVALRLLGAGVTASGEPLQLTRPALAQSLVALAVRACGRSVDVREWTSPMTDGATAMVTGVGKRGHVLLSTDVVRDWADDEIRVVVAHELSHHAHHDLTRTVALDAVLWCAALWVADRVVATWGNAFGLSSVGDLAALPLLTVAAGAAWGLARPLRLAQSRAHERRADRFALEHTGNVEAFRRALRRLGEQHLAEERPSRLTRWFFHRHPPLEERLALGQAFSARRR